MQDESRAAGHDTECPVVRSPELVGDDHLASSSKSSGQGIVLAAFLANSIGVACRTGKLALVVEIWGAIVWCVTSRGCVRHS